MGTYRRVSCVCAIVNDSGAVTESRYGCTQKVAVDAIVKGVRTSERGCSADDKK